MSRLNSPGPATGDYWNPHPWRKFGLWRFGPADGSGGYWRRVVFPGIWLLYLIPLTASFGHRRGAAHLAGAITLVVAFAAVYLVVVGWWDRWPQRALPLLALRGLGALLGWLASLACVIYGSAAAPLWIYVAVVAGIAIGSQWVAIRFIVAVAAAYSAFSLSGHETTGDFLSGLLPLLFGGLAALGFRARMELTHELTRANETVALLAASEERLRLARDMHDLTGQSLSTITLKSDLAARVLDRLPSSPERDRAREEVRQIAEVSRQALRDVREALSGYRRPTLAVEAITARAALEAAGITAHDDTALTLALSSAGTTPLQEGPVDPDAEAALAWCLREAVTNVVRHSGARNCWLTLRRTGGELVLEVRDDGRGMPGTTAQGVGKAGISGVAGDHSGLHGISERLSAVGGRLEISPGGGSGGFRLIATVPAREGASVAR